MQVEKYNGDVEFSELFMNKKPEKVIKKAIENPENKTITIHKDGSRCIFGGVVYEFNNGKRERLGLSFRNTTVTIMEAQKKEVKDGRD